jgi:hypothetical protein
LEDLLQKLTPTSCSAYADDIKIYNVIGNSNDQALLQTSLSTVHDWGEVNCLRLNSSKCSVITFSRKRQIIRHDYTVAGVSLKRVKDVVDLGVLLNEQMNLNRHVDFVVSKAMSLLGLVKRFGKALQDFDAIRLLYCALVRSTLEYAAIVWTPYHKFYHDKIEAVQKKFLMFILPFTRDPTNYALPPYIDRLTLVRLKPLWVRRLTASASFMYDLLLGSIRCPSLREMVVINTNTSRRLRNREYLNIIHHRTDYGRFEPLNKCRLAFNRAAGIFLNGHSRQMYRTLCEDLFTLTQPYLRV